MVRASTRVVCETLITLLITSFIVFLAMYLAPGDKATLLAGGPENLSPENLAAINEQYHFDEPFIVQYGYWLAGALQGDFGRSYIYGQNVAELMSSRLPVTMTLVLYAVLINVVLGIVLGVVSALRRGTVVDSAILGLTTFLNGIPPFVAAVALIAVFSVSLGWFPSTGAGEGIVERIYYLTLPAFALAATSVAVLTRVTRQSVVGEASAPHVEVARARGLDPQYIVRNHVLRNSMAPIITMAGLISAGTIAGTVIVEQAFGLSGVGTLLIDSIDSRDMPVTQAVLLFLVFAYIITTRISDVLQRVADPRLRGAS